MCFSSDFRYSGIESSACPDRLRATELTARAIRGIAPPSLSQRENAICSARRETTSRPGISRGRAARARRALLRMSPDPNHVAFHPAEQEKPVQLGTSPLSMCRSVPQMVVLVILTIALVAAASAGLGRSSKASFPGPTHTSAFISTALRLPISADTYLRDLRGRFVAALCLGVALRPGSGRCASLAATASFGSRADPPRARRCIGDVQLVCRRAAA